MRHSLSYFLCKGGSMKSFIVLSILYYWANIGLLLLFVFYADCELEFSTKNPPKIAKSFFQVLILLVCSRRIKKWYMKTRKKRWERENPLPPLTDPTQTDGSEFPGETPEIPPRNTNKNQEQSKPFTSITSPQTQDPQILDHFLANMGKYITLSYHLLQQTS